MNYSSGWAHVQEDQKHLQDYFDEKRDKGADWIEKILSRLNKKEN